LHQEMMVAPAPWLTARRTADRLSGERGNGPLGRALTVKALIALVVIWCFLVLAAIVAASTRRFQGWDMYLAIAAVVVGLAIAFAIVLLP
jgi:hypothetical protein